jgi:hypothetical protein
MTYLLPLVLFIVPLGAFITIVELWTAVTRRRDRRSPVVGELLRAPGQSLQENLNDLRARTIALLLLVCGIPTALYACYLNYLFVENGPSGLAIFEIIAGAGIFTWLFGLCWMTRLFKQRRILQLGMDAEMAAGQELNQLMLDGYSVFHDLPAQNFNIDHVVVGRSGVYAVETKGRPKVKLAEGGGAEVICDGKSLAFPVWRESEPLKQATRQAKWLSDWLTTAVGEPIRAKPILILLGWFIKRTGIQEIPVLSGREVRDYLLGRRAVELSSAQIHRICHQLDRRCRNVAPKAYQS